jgi:hypothetical protein
MYEGEFVHTHANQLQKLCDQFINSGLHVSYEDVTNNLLIAYHLLITFSYYV